MNETELRELLADRASAVVGASDRYAGVRQRITTRKRARLASGAAAIVLVLAGVAAVVPRLGDGRAETVASLGWAARGELTGDPQVAEAISGFDEPSLLFAGTPVGRAAPDARARWVVVEAKEGRRPVVLLLRLDDTTTMVLARAEPSPDARSVSFAGTYPDSPRDGILLVLAAPGIERAKLPADGGVTPVGEGLVALPFRLTDVDNLRVELYTTALETTEHPGGRFVLPDEPPAGVPETLDGADPRALGWEPRVYERPVGLGCDRAVFCGQLDADQFGVLFARRKAGGEITVKFVVHRRSGSTGYTVETFTPPVEVVTRFALTDRENPRMFLLAAPSVTHFRIQYGYGPKDVIANDGWAWAPFTGGGGTATAFEGDRRVGSGTF